MMVPHKRPNADTMSDEIIPEVIPGMTTSEIRQARRKIQNRVNQRAFRKYMAYLQA